MHNQYGTFRKLQMLCWLLRTKIIWRRARLIRFPFDLRGKKYIDPGTGLTTARRMPVGSLFQRAVRSPLWTERTIERSRTYLRHARNRDRQSRTDGQQDLTYPTTVTADTIPRREIRIRQSPPLERSYQIEPVSIGDKTWIGDNVCILPGTRIGRGSVVGANSVVRGVFPDYCVIVGAPARIVKRYDPVRKGWYRTDPRGEFVS